MLSLPEQNKLASSSGEVTDTLILSSIRIFLGFYGQKYSQRSKLTLARLESSRSKGFG